MSNLNLKQTEKDAMKVDNQKRKKAASDALQASASASCASMIQTALDTDKKEADMLQLEKDSKKLYSFLQSCFKDSPTFEAWLEAKSIFGEDDIKTMVEDKLEETLPDFLPPNRRSKIVRDCEAIRITLPAVKLV